MALPVTFFQVSATAIPTLLIAVAVGGRVGDRLGRGVLAGTAKSSAVGSFIVLSVALTICTAEMVSLLAIAKGYGATWEGQVVAAAIMLCLLLLSHVFLDVLLSGHDAAGKVWYRRAFLAAFIAGTGIAWLALSTISRQNG